MAKIKSTVPGMPYPSGRDNLHMTSFAFLEGRRKDDNAEGLWRINDNLYDLEPFVKNHPGGPEWLTMTKGTDITEAFEAHHITNKAERLLAKFFVRKAAEPRALQTYTFNSNGFYKKFKERACEVLQNVDFHHPTMRSKLIADFLASMAILSVIAVAHYKSWIFMLISGLFLSWTAIVAHNFFHMRDNFRMYYFDLSTMSSKEWRISHVLSHHLYPNTLWDLEILMFEPFFAYLPQKKSILYRLISLTINPIVMSCGFIAQGIKRYYSAYFDWKTFEFRDVVPFILPLIMSYFTSSLFEAIKLWLCVLMIASFFFHFVGLTAAHHHPEIFHDGDICRSDRDWGLMELDAVRDRKVIDDSLFLVLVSFGSHGLHHLLPTVDHDYLELCLPAFHQTCLEFGVELEKFSQWELIKGQYQQLIREEPKHNYRGGRDAPARSL